MTMDVDINSILIPYRFQKDEPSQKKVLKHINYYKKNNSFKSEIVIDKKFKLLDGYIDYLLAIKCNLKTITCVVLPNNKYSQWRYSDEYRKQIRKKLYINQHGLCARCGKLMQIKNRDKESYMSIEHIVPVLIGGSDEFRNLIGICPNCSSISSHKLNEEIVKRKNISLCSQHKETLIQLNI